MEDSFSIQRHSEDRPGSQHDRSNEEKKLPNLPLRRLVDALLRLESAQRPALSRHTGLPKHVVSDLLANLETRGLVKVTGAHDGMPGRSQLTYAMRADAAFSFGFDVGGTKIAGALCDMRGKILAELTEPTNLDGIDKLVHQICEMGKFLCESVGRPRFHVRNTAIGVPAAVDPVSGSLSLAGNLRGVEGVALREVFASALSTTVHLDNDVNLALIAETTNGAARGRNNVAFVALGTGIGAALLINGKILRGAFGGAGEIGYLPLWKLDPAGTASLENQVGEAGIRALHAQNGGASGHSVRDIFEASSAGDPIAGRTLDMAAETVSRGIVAVLAIADPDMIVLGGSIGARDEFIERIRGHVENSWIRPITVCRSTAGGRAGLLGAIEIARQNLLESLFGPA